jgi:ElaB/YqjD/DUF883 family membrane-anchored ribosome-binding protein
MGDNRTELPEGTDTIITGAENLGTMTGAATGSEAGGDETALTTGTTTGTERDLAASTGETESGLKARLRSGGEKLSAQAGDRARGLVSQGLERSAEALANVGKLVGDTATGLEERLGPEYGDYARRAAAAIENTANSIASKDADELIDDTREFVRRSPGVAIAGAAIVGFALARLIKSGLDSGRGDDDEDDRA